MFCGKRSFSQIDTEPLPTSPKGSKLKQSLSMTKKKKQSSSSNPYSTSGLDKFEKVLEELDKKKEKILLRARSQGGATVRFTYRSDSDDWIPIIIKKREPREAKDAKAKSSRPRVTKRLSSAPPSMKVEKGLEVTKEPKEVVTESKDIIKVKKRGVYGWGVCFWSLVIVLVLVLLVFGRSFAICWTAIWWYLVPLMKGKSKGFKRKELWRRVSDKKLGGGVDGFRSFKGHISERT
ncbi:uncharacterized protein A4U43_C08F12110 [Asparagus officinalis]|uniref:uncharacterized protein LOC109822514 n=1 Tax=Asparagus officinalis TaxID=4686 RepID=UPI00098E514F|nr:uncharacterized protein LOC109822514 [Asparagus officinalis]ONK59900.1 uncharacterized protein A4U43_C08F12110 [Asparagus officinalis]